MKEIQLLILEKEIIIKFAKKILRMSKMKEAKILILISMIMNWIVIEKREDPLIKKFSNKKNKMNKILKFKKIKLINMLHCIRMLLPIKKHWILNKICKIWISLSKQIWKIFKASRFITSNKKFKKIRWN